MNSASNEYKNESDSSCAQLVSIGLLYAEKAIHQTQPIYSLQCSLYLLHESVCFLQSFFYVSKQDISLVENTSSNISKGYLKQQP